MGNEKWTVYAKRADFNAISETFHIDPVVARIIRNRDVIGDEAIQAYLYGGLEQLNDPFLLKGMDTAVAIVKKKIAEKKKIRVVGDYDIDGIMSSYILKKGIGGLGGDVDVRIPDRVSDGYGINLRMVEEAEEDGVDTIITCDNGISAIKEVSRAKEHGMTVIVTDHHEVLEVPCADAVIDAKQPGDTYPYKELCGASVAWKLVIALGGDPELKFLEFAAFATIGDIVDLTGENRAIVKEGMRRLKRTDNIGFQALAEVCGINLSDIAEYHIGFVLGPCFNASGRLGSAERAIRLLESDTRMEALNCARELKDLNDDRKSMTEQGTRQAVEMIESENLTDGKVLVICLPGIHESVAGIVAGRIKETYSRPTFVLTTTESGLKGSGRSIPGYSMFEELVKVRDLLTKFGGHPMAAGLTLPRENLGEFTKRLNENCSLTEEDLLPKVTIDVPMPISYVTEELISQLELLAPFGKANERPVFAQKNVFCSHPRVFGANRNVLKMHLRTMTRGGDADPVAPGFQADLEGPSLEGICFGNADELKARIEECPELDIVYIPQINEFKGLRRIQIRITHFK